jgi:hypothetical protein
MQARAWTLPHPWDQPGWLQQHKLDSPTARCAHLCSESLYCSRFSSGGTSPRMTRSISSLSTEGRGAAGSDIAVAWRFPACLRACQPRRECLSTCWERRQHQRGPLHARLTLLKCECTRVGSAVRGWAGNEQCKGR